MYGDLNHKALLNDEWGWDGENYLRNFSYERYGDSEGEALRLSPSQPKDYRPSILAEVRKKGWDLHIRVLNTHSGMMYWSRVCSYKNFKDAANAVLGNS